MCYHISDAQNVTPSYGDFVGAPWINPGGQGEGINYTGEYQFFLETQANGGFWYGQNFHYSYEIVSFPFIPDLDNADPFSRRLIVLDDRLDSSPAKWSVLL